VATSGIVVTVTDVRPVAATAMKPRTTRRSQGVLVGGRQDRGFDAAVLAALFFAALLGVLGSSGCIAGNEDRPRTGPGLEPPFMGPATPTDDGSNGFEAPIMGPETAAGGPASPMTGTAGTGASAGAGATPPPSGAPTGAAGMNMAGSSGLPGSAGSAGSDPSSADAGAMQCEAERIPALALGQRRIAPPSDAGAENACEYELPLSAAPYLPDQLNLQLARDGQHENVPRVTDLASCDPTAGGFYYDSLLLPTRVIACPATCTRFGEGGDVDIVLGCPTLTL
jgi:hypothetical protein